MMKKLLGLFLLCAPCHAQEPTPLPAKVVAIVDSESPAPPTSLRPRGVKLLRSGTALIGPGGSPAWLLFYGHKPKGAGSNTVGFSENALLVNLKVATRRKVGKNWRWSTLRTVSLGLCEDFFWRQAEVMWLNPKLKTGPILKVPRFEGDELIVFTTGWQQKKAVRQSFYRSASSIEATAYLFDVLDEKGQLMVRREHSENDDSRRTEHLYLHAMGRNRLERVSQGMTTG